MKTSKLFMMSAAVVLFATVACNKDQNGGEDPEVDVPVIEVENTQIQVTSNSQTVSVAFNVTNAVENETVSASADADWLSVAVGSDAVTLTVSANETESDRSAIVTLSYSGADDVSFTLTQVVPVISVTSEVTFGQDEGTETLSYSVRNAVDGGTLSATVVNDVSWLSAEVGDNTITLTVSENTEADPRTATVTLSYPYAQSVDLIVVQNAPFVASYEDFLGTWVVTEELYWSSATIEILADDDNTGYIITGWQWSEERLISDFTIEGIEGTNAFPASYNSETNALEVRTYEFGTGTLDGDDGSFWLLGRVYIESSNSYSTITGNYVITTMTLTDTDNGAMTGGSVNLSSGTYSCMQMRYVFLKSDAVIYWTKDDGSYFPSTLVKVSSQSNSASVKSSEKPVPVLGKMEVIEAAL